MGPDFEDKEEVEDARQAVDLLKQNQINEIDVNRHLSLLLDQRAFSAKEISENARKLLELVKLAD